MISRIEINKTKVEDISSQLEKLINLVLHLKERIDIQDCKLEGQRQHLKWKNKIIIFLVMLLLVLICYLIFSSL